MDRRWAFLFPGQGAQVPGMARDFYETFSIAKETFQEADDLLSSAFSKVIFEGPASELTLTKNSQIAIFIASIAIARTLKSQFPDIHPTVCAGLSLGEYTALTASGKLSFAKCLSLVRVRAEAMHRACEENPGTMCVVLGLSEEDVAAVLHDLAESLWIANLNCPEQVVIAGAREAIPSAIEALKKKGAKRVLPLEVSGAFHSGFMASAQAALKSEIDKTSLIDTSVSLVMNVPGGYVADTQQMKRYLFEQVVSPVRWEKGIRAMSGNVDLFLEMGPGKTLSGMNKRIGVSVPTFSIEKISDLDQIMREYAIT